MLLLLGGTGLLGTELRLILDKRGVDYVTSGRKEVDLRNQTATFNFIKKYKPKTIVILAAHVGGLYANKLNPAKFLLDNVRIYTNVLSAAAESGVPKLVFVSSSVMYPEDAISPITTDSLFKGPLNEDLQYFGISKLVAVKLIEAYKKMGIERWFTLVFPNLYGRGDNSDVHTNHVIPSLLIKFEKAKRDGEKEIRILGSSNARREFLHSSDAAAAILFCLEQSNFFDSVVNAGSGVSTRIGDLARQIAAVTRFKGDVSFESELPIQSPKVLDSSKILQIGWRPSVNLVDGISDVYNQWKALGLL